MPSPHPNETYPILSELMTEFHTWTNDPFPGFAWAGVRLYCALLEAA